MTASKSSPACGRIFSADEVAEFRAELDLIRRAHDGQYEVDEAIVPRIFLGSVYSRELGKALTLAEQRRRKRAEAYQKRLERERAAAVAAEAEAERLRQLERDAALEAATRARYPRRRYAEKEVPA